MSNDLSSNILVGAAHALAHVEGLRQVLQALLDPIAGDNLGSAAIVIASAGGGLEIAASLELDDAAAAGLTAAIGCPGHPIARTMHQTTADVRRPADRAGRAGPAQSPATDRDPWRNGLRARRACPCPRCADRLGNASGPSAVADLAAVTVERYSH